MRKTASVLLGAGAFALGLAVLTPTVLSPALLKGPAEIDLTTYSRSEAQKLNSATGELEPVTVELVRKIATHAEEDGGLAGTSDTAVFDELLNLAVVGPDGDLQTVDARGRYTGLRAGFTTVAFDRKTGEGRPGFSGDTWNTTGQTVKFPFGTEKRTYDYYDQTSRKAWPVEFVRETEVKGLDVYEFQGTIPETRLGQYGVLEGTDTLYSNAGRTLLVEPVTGAIVSSTTSPQTSIEFADGRVQQALLVEELVPTDATVAERVDYAKDAKSSAVLLQRAPWVLGALGLLLLVAGLLVGRRRREPVVEETTTTTRTQRPDVVDLLPPARTEEPGRHTVRPKQ